MMVKEYNQNLISKKGIKCNNIIKQYKMINFDDVTKKNNKRT